MGESPVKGFFRPSGAPCRTRLFPWLAPWATFSRPSGADAHESYQQNVETPGPSFARMHKAEPCASADFQPNAPACGRISFSLLNLAARIGSRVRRKRNPDR